MLKLKVFKNLWKNFWLSYNQTLSMMNVTVKKKLFTEFSYDFNNLTHTMFFILISHKCKFI